MNQPIVYLSFNGNCKNAMSFYQRCFGGELIFQTVGDTSASRELPTEMKDYVLEAVLDSGGIVIMGTDLIDAHLCQGNAVSILLDCKTREEMKDFYEKLSEAGEQTHPIAEGLYGGLKGMLTDRYGFQWLLRCRC